MRPLGRVLPVPAVALTLALLAAGCGGTTTVVADRSEPAATGAAATDAPTATTAQVPTAAAPATTAAPRTATAATAPAPATDAEAPGGGVLVERPTDFPNPGEGYLLARLHPEIVRRCTRALSGSLSRGAVAGLVCAPPSAAATRIHYELFPTREGAEDAYGRYRRANDVPLDGGRCPAAGRGDGEQAWQGGRRHGRGRAMCFSADGRWLVSSHPGVRALAFLHGTRPGPLAALWTSRARPTLRPQTP